MVLTVNSGSPPASVGCHTTLVADGLIVAPLGPLWLTLCEYTWNFFFWMSQTCVCICLIQTLIPAPLHAAAQISPYFHRCYMNARIT